MNDTVENDLSAIVTIRRGAYDLLFVFNRNYTSILYRL